MRNDPDLHYFDYNATTPVAPEVLDAMLPFLTDHWGNPSSGYRFGTKASQAIEKARAQVAALINASPKQILFTSCGTEASNSAIHSALKSQPTKTSILTTTVEHPATLSYIRMLKSEGVDCLELPVDSTGQLDFDLLTQSITEKTALLSVMWANNESGIVFPIEAISKICKTTDVLLHTDAVQAAGKESLDVKQIPVDLLSLSAHKLRAPKGIGALYVKDRSQFSPLIHGGGQENKARGGTENVPYIVGFGKASELALENLESERDRLRVLRDRIEDFILSRISDTQRNNPLEPRLTNTTSIAFPGAEAEAAVHLLDQVNICVSSGSACATGSLHPSHVLTAMHLSKDQARCTLRFSLGYDTTDDDVNYLLSELPPIIARLRGVNPVTQFS